MPGSWLSQYALRNARLGPALLRDLVLQRRQRLLQLVLRRLRPAPVLHVRPAFPGAPGAARAARGGPRHPGVPRILAPQLLEPPVPPAPRAVRRVADRALLVEVLVVVLRGVEGLQPHDLGHDRLRQPSRGVERALRLLRRAPLCLVLVEDRRAVLVPPIAELPSAVGRVHVVPEGLEELPVAQPRGVVGHLHRLGVAGRPLGHLLVRRVLDSAARVARDDRDDAGDLLQRRLDAPEAAAGEGGTGERRRGRSGAAGVPRGREEPQPAESEAGGEDAGPKGHGVQGNLHSCKRRPGCPRSASPPLRRVKSREARGPPPPAIGYDGR